MNDLIEIIRQLVLLNEFKLAERVLLPFSKNPCTSLQYATLGMCQELLSNKKLAVDYYEKGYKLTTNDEEIYIIGNRLIELYVEQGDKQKAKIHLEINRKIKPSAELQYWYNLLK